MTRIAPRLLGFLLLSGLATSPALAQMYNAGDACPEPTPGRVFTQEGAAGPALVCNGTTLEVYESVLTGPLRKGIGTATPQATLDISSTDSVLLPRGTTAERPGTPVNGMIRYNSTNNKFEAYENGAWTNVIGGGTASAAGNTEEIQFNSGGNLAATSDFYWDITNKYLTLDSGAANLDSTMAFANAGTRQWLLANRGSNSSPANSLLLYNHGTVNSGYVTMALTQNGDVGIGTASPAATLHVNGEAIIGNTSLACSGTTEGAQRYNSTDHVMEFCNGTSWTPFAQVQSTSGPTAPAGSGYFVLTDTTWNGDLGGLTGADAKCLTELGTTYTSWRGYSTANSNGQITAGKVHAFLCDGTACNNLMPLTTYYFAYANSGTPGGASFTTDASGIGPNDSTLWSAANYFSGTYTYWMGRDNTSDPWLNTPAWARCVNWSSNTSGDSATYGYSAASDGSRFWLSEATCDNSKRLICFVNP